MSARLRRLVLALALPLVALPATPPPAGAEPFLVVYGPSAPREEGDPDHQQTVYFAIPAGWRDTVHIRVFDPDVGGAFDTRVGGWKKPLYGFTDATRFSLYGGPGAFQGPRPEAEGSGYGGHLLFETIFGDAPARDGRWRTLVSLDPAQGDLFDRERIFRLRVEGAAGSDGNAFDLDLSRKDDRNLPIPGARIFAYEVGFRALQPDDRIELRFDVPAGARRLRIANYDAAGGILAAVTPFRSEALRASENGRWRQQELAIEAAEQGRPAAVSYFGGREAPNDLSVTVTELLGEGRGFPLPLQLPLRRLDGNTPPQARADVLALDCFRVALDASGSADNERDPIRYRWIFHDGTTSEDPQLTRRYPGPGRYPLRLEVRDDAAQVGNGSALDFEVAVKPPPIARIATLPALVAVGERLQLDASPSGRDPRDRPGRTIGSYRWFLSDGTEYAGIGARHAFAAPGRYKVTLLVRDDSGEACDTAVASAEVEVNAPPLAEAGPDLLLGTEEAFTLDGSASRDPDGSIWRYRWDLGNGETAEGVSPRYAYALPGSYRVTLTVEDTAGVANSAASDSLTVTVDERAGYRAPSADAGGGREALVGEPLRFDAGGSRAPGGNLLDYRWDFGDGAAGSGPEVVHTYWQPGRYRLRLTVEDESGFAEGRVEDRAEILVRAPGNASPLADAGGDREARVGERLIFDARGSRDPDGRVLAYDWDFGDGSGAAGEAVLHAFQAGGRYPVRLRVADDAAAVGESLVTVTVRE